MLICSKTKGFSSLAFNSLYYSHHGSLHSQKISSTLDNLLNDKRCRSQQSPHPQAHAVQYEVRRNHASHPLS